MRDILARDGVQALADLACSNVLLGFDYDGTLARIASTPGAARMRLATRRLLSQVARRYPCVVISGRTHADLVTRLGGIPLWQIFGNHGLEPWAANNEALSVVREWMPQLQALVATHAGLVIEDKRYSVAVHYRHVRERARVRQAIAKVTRGLRNVRVLGGAEAVNLLPLGAPDKGTALHHARRALACDTAIYVGDDDTDEVAFASAPPSQLLGIRVGPARISRAAYRLQTQRDIDRLLRTLLTLRAGASALPAAPVDGST
jgi:trehalose 6-phosphate phosphatase